MRRVALRAVFGGVVFAASGACIPARDNPHDSSRTPVASLRFADATTGDGSGCLDPVADRNAILARPETLTINHGRCLALIAEGSKDPQTGVDGLEFQYFYVTTASEISYGSPGPEDIFVVTPAALADKPIGTSITFKSKVLDKTGAGGTTTSKIILGNEAPIPPTPHPIRLPLGGHPWAPGEDFTVFFDATATFDPENDLIQSYCWRFDDDPDICSADPQDPLFTRVIDSGSPDRLIARFHACDDENLCSAPVATVVIVGPETLWAHVGGSTLPPGFVRIDVSQRAIPLATTNPSFSVPAITDAKPIPGSPDVVALAWYDDTPCADSYLEVVPIGDSPTIAGAFFLGDSTGPVDLATNASGTQLWALVAACGPLADTRLLRFDLTGTTLSAPVVDLAIAPTNGSTSDSIALDVDGDGNAWAFSAFDDSFRVYSPSGDELAEIASDLPPYYAPRISHRPDSGEIWIYRGYDLTREAASLTRHASLLSSETATLPILADAPAWIDADRFWTLWGSAGTVVVDANTFFAPDGPQFLTTIPMSVVGGMADPGNGDLWGLFGGGFTFVHATLQGDVDIFVQDGVYDMYFVDAAGLMWFQYQSELWRGETPNLEAPLDAFAIPFSPLAAPAPNGGVGFNSFADGGWREHAGDGAFLGLRPLAPVAGTATLDPGPFFQIRGIPGSHQALGAWFDFIGGTGLSFYWIDFDAGTYELAFDAAFMSMVTEPAFEPSAPIAGHTSYVWTVLDQGSGSEIVTVSPSGQISSHGAYTMPQQAHTRIVRSVASNALCVATLQDEISPAHLQILYVTSGGGTSVVVDDANVDWSGGPIAGLTAAVSHDELGDICWVAYRKTDLFAGPDTIRGFRSNGTVVAEGEFPGEFIMSLKGDGARGVLFGSTVNEACDCVQRLAVVGTSLVPQQVIQADVDEFVSYETRPRFDNWTGDIR